MFFRQYASGSVQHSGIDSLPANFTEVGYETVFARAALVAKVVHIASRPAEPPYASKASDSPAHFWRLSVHIGTYLSP